MRFFLPTGRRRVGGGGCVFRRRRCVRLRTREEMASFRGTKNSLTRARGNRRERGRRDRARGETTREMRAGRNDGCGESRFAFFLADVSAARSGGARWRDSQSFLDLFFVVVFELSLKVMMKRVLLCPFRAKQN